MYVRTLVIMGPSTFKDSVTLLRAALAPSVAAAINLVI